MNPIYNNTSNFYLPLEENQNTVKQRQDLALKIANEKIPLDTLNLTETEMLKLAPCLTYLCISSDIYPEEFIGKLLEKTVQLTDLVIRHCDFTGVALGRIKNVGQLKNLLIRNCLFNSPLPDGMGALQSLTICQCEIYNQPFPKGMGDLQALDLTNCFEYDQPFPERMDALKVLTVYQLTGYSTYQLKHPLPSKMDALEEISCPIELSLPESMLSLKSIQVPRAYFSFSQNRDPFLKALLGIYQIDRARALQLAAQHLQMDEKELLNHLFKSNDPYDNKKIQHLIEKITPKVLGDLIRRKDIPFVHDANLKDDPLQKLYIYNIYSRILANFENLLEHTELVKKVFTLVVQTPMPFDLKNFYGMTDNFSYSDLIPLFQFIVANMDIKDLNTEKRAQFLAYVLRCSRNQEVLLCNLINLEKSGLFNAFRQAVPSTFDAPLNAVSDFLNTMSEEKIFNGNSDSDHKTFYQMLADELAKKKTSIFSLKLSEDEMLELAPYLTYLNMSDDATDRFSHIPWFSSGRVREFMGRLLEKTERLSCLRIKSIQFDGSALVRIKNVEKLESLEICECPNFNHTLPAGMDSLRSLVIRDCNSFNQPLSVNVAQLDRLVVQRCNFLKSNSLLNSIMPVYKIDRERGLKLGASLGFDAEFLQIYSGIWSEDHEPDSDTYYRTLAKFIADKKIPIQKFKLSKDELRELAPHLTYLNLIKFFKIYGEEFIQELLEKTEKLEHLIIRDMSCPLPSFNVGNLQTLEIIEGPYFDYTLPEGMSALRKIVIAHCPFYNKPLPQGMIALESLHFYDCESYNQRLPEGLSALKELSFDNCFDYNQPLPQGMTALESIGIDHCRSFNRDTLLSIILPIYEVDHDRGNGLAASLGILDQLRLYINLCESNDDEAIAQSLTQLMTKRITLPPSGLSKIEEFIKREAGKKFVRKHRRECLVNPQLRGLLFSLYPPNKKKNFSLYNKVKLLDHILYLTLLPKTALDVPDALFVQIKKHLLGPERVDRLSVQFHGNAGIDAGGLRRQLVGQLLPQLLTKSKIFKFESTSSGKVLPQATTTLTDEDIENYRALGIFLGIAYCQKNPTGEVFSEKWLQCIYSLKANLDGDIPKFLDGMDHAALKMFMEDCTAQDEQLMKPYGIVLTSEDATEVLETATTLNSVWEDDDLQAAIESRNIEEVRKIVRSAWIAPNVITYLKMAQAMVRGFKEALSVRNPESLDTFWTDLQFMKAEEFSERLQGKLSAEWIAKKITVTPENSPKALEIKVWLEEWIENHKDDYQSLASLVQTLTGARALIAPVTFKIRSGIDSVHPHTCFSGVDVPDNIDKHTFMAILDAYGEGKDLAFTRM